MLSWVLPLALASSAVASDPPTLDELLNLDPPEVAPETPSPEVSDTTETPAAPDLPLIDLPSDADIEEALTQETLTENFALAVAEMAQVTRHLDQRDPGLPTQRLQQRILDRLEQLIDAASSSSSSSGGGGGGDGQPQPGNQDNTQNQPGQQPGQQPQPGQGGSPASASATGTGENQGQFSPGSVGPVEPGEKSLDELRSEWGALPPRLRDELSDGLDEPYSPVYRDATEAYYRRLAEEAGR